jgi:hypothetical protein
LPLLCLLLLLLLLLLPLLLPPSACVCCWSLMPVCAVRMLLLLRVPADNVGLEVLVAGDSERCRLCLVNEPTSWAAGMEAQAGGPAHRLPLGPATVMSEWGIFLSAWFWQL